jgi:hypothetical protein
MKTFKTNMMRSVAALPIALALAAGAIATVSTVNPQPAVASCNPCAAAKPAAACNPCAAKNPCAAAACNPCAAKKAECNPCNPCAAKAACNPCAAKNPCAAANPCAAKAACNPCKAAAACNPCNPCAAGAAGAASGCYVPRLKTASACNPCAAKNPCAAAACNPCAANKAACNPCNPCAAKNPCAAAANPCAAKNPCAAANPCNPCNPCAAAAADVELTEAEAVALFDCLMPVMKKAYKGGQHWAATKWSGFTNVSVQPYTSATHGGRKVVNLSNKIGAKTYQKYENVKKMPVGSTLAKPSFTIGKDGQANLGPLFIMEKMTKGFNADTADWRYAAIMPAGATMGITKGINAGTVEFCHQCHVSGEENDYMLFQPEEFRRK